MQKQLLQLHTRKLFSLHADCSLPICLMYRLTQAAVSVSAQLTVAIMVQVPMSRCHRLTCTLSCTCSGDGQRQPLSSILFRRSAQDWEDLGLTVLAVLLSVLIAAIVLRKIFVATGSGSDVNMDADMSSFD